MALQVTSSRPDVGGVLRTVISRHSQIAEISVFVAGVRMLCFTVSTMLGCTCRKVPAAIAAASAVHHSEALFHRTKQPASDSKTSCSRDMVILESSILYLLVRVVTSS